LRLAETSCAAGTETCAVSLKIGCHYLLKTDPNHEMNLTQSNNSDPAISAYGIACSTIKGAPLSPDELRKTDA
jgi:hypothetical protein